MTFVGMVEAGPDLFGWEVECAGYLAPPHALVAGKADRGHEFPVGSLRLFLAVDQQGLPVFNEPPASEKVVVAALLETVPQQTVRSKDFHCFVGSEVIELVGVIRAGVGRFPHRVVSLKNLMIWNRVGQAREVVWCLYLVN
ncbi:hypothetical protein [Arthrobacter pityocampae]|uniref:hypothetical protein n=1 Tax=Arthrobacter pityocampae TaxID=547334 RepID=UPI0037355263